MSGPRSAEKRRAGGAIRVPFVRRCQIEYDGGGESTSAFIVNINVLGAYIEMATMPSLGRQVRCRFRTPGHEQEIETEGVVAWTNPVQEHPVHSLPPGFGVAFRTVSDEVRARIEDVVFDYLEQQKS